MKVSAHPGWLGKGQAKALQCVIAVAGGKPFQAHDAGVAGPVQCAGDSRVADLAGAGFAAAGDVGAPSR